mgnify:FL=1|jgi:glutamyl-tRNA reductase
MDLNLVGLNHKTAPIEIREKFVFSHDMLSHVLKDLRLKTGAKALILSTCNRTEIYFQSKDPKEIYQWLSSFNDIKFSELKKYLYTHSNQDCYVHACKVASGLDSMLIGETQIFGQMKQASQVANLSGVQGKFINTFFQDIFKTAKKVRTETQIGSSPTTIASCALSIAKKIFGEINQTQVMFVGAGEISEMCAKYFQKHHPKKISIANRSFEKGEALAKKVNGEACLIGEIYDQLHNYDILISSTASQLPIIGLGMIEQALSKRKHRPIMLVDLAIPRDIESEVSKLDDVFLYTLDDLVKIAQQGVINRQDATKKANQIIEYQAKDFYHKSKQIKNIPTIKLLRDQFENIALIEAKKARNSIKIGSPSEEVIDKLISNLTKKFLHGPTTAIRDNGQDTEIDSLIKKIYNIKEEKK